MRGAIAQYARILTGHNILTSHDAFVEIEDGVEGLVRMSEMDWTNKNVNPAKVVHTGEEVEVMVLDVDEERRRISLGLSIARPTRGRSSPRITSAAITSRGRSNPSPLSVFSSVCRATSTAWCICPMCRRIWQGGGGAQLPEGPAARSDGAVDRSGREYPLARHQATRQGSVPPTAFVAECQGSVVKGTVKVDARGAMIDLGNGIEAQLRASEAGRERVG